MPNLTLGRLPQSVADVCAMLRAHGATAEEAAALVLEVSGVTTELLTPTQFSAAIAEKERARLDDPALTRACVNALRRGGPLPRVPLRAVRVWSPTGRPIPREFDGVFVEPGEVVVRYGPLPAPYVGCAALIANGAELPAAEFKDDDRERIAQVLADELLREVP